jgi:hypothetical protein
MELAIPLIALGGMYVISNKNSETSKNIYNESFVSKTVSKTGSKKENFDNMGKKPNYLPNTQTPPQNYPIMNNPELIDTVQEYPNPNNASDKYFNQNAYEQRERAGKTVGDTIQQVYSLTGDYMKSDQFRHNNMVPFNGGKPRGQVYNNNNAETILDNYAGTGSQIIKKIEQAPLFKPQENVQWTNGAPNMSEFYQSRVNPALKNNMVKPFESVRVGPGLDKGYTASGSNGYNAGMEARDQWLPKTVDELRIATNPKEEFSLINHQGPAQASITNVGILGKVEKNRPDTFFINSQDRWLTTTGAEKAQRVIADEDLKHHHRSETTAHLTGTPNAVLKTASYVPKQHEASKRMQLDAANHIGHSNAVGSGPHTDGEAYLKSHTNYTNSRSVNQQPQTFGSGFSGAIGAVIAPLMDVFKPARKEEYVCNMRVYGNMIGEVPGNYVLTQGDVPVTTVKETTLYQPNGYIGNQLNGAYQVTDQQAITNQRDTTTEFCQMNPSGGAGTRHGAKQYDSVYRQTNNEAKEKSVVGRTNQGNMSMFNSDMNVSYSKLDSDRDNNRMWAPSAVIPSGPSVRTYGKAHMPQYNNQCTTGCDRINPDILDNLKKNPYAFPFNSVA